MDQGRALAEAEQYLSSKRDSRTAQDEVAQAEFASRKWVWVVEKEEGYLAGYIVAENGDEVRVHLNNGKDVAVNINDTEKMNPPKFDKVEDMADLTYLNEASVIHNLRLRYLSNLIYTYSGLFLVAVNPYKRLPIYSDQVVTSYKNKKRNERPPHIYAISDAAYHDMLQDRENQSILITGESGAGKTENTKKVIQHLASIAMSANLEQSSTNDGSGSKEHGTLEQQILQANPILESFGNAQTIRNNNSSRFGKFIRIEFNSGGQIVGANIERYLLEKSRVTHQTNKERSYHIFYQLLRGAPAEIKKELLLDGQLEDYTFVSTSNKTIDGVDDASEFKALCESFEIMKITKEEQMDLFRAIAAVLHLGNIKVTEDREDQAQLPDSSVAEKVCHVLGIPIADFAKGLLKPRIKAGRDWVVQARNVDQVLYSLEALARAIYERMFGSLVDRINKAIDRPSAAKSSFIGVLDIAGFEIFEKNSFEQFCINYNNEKLQQFFNTHMFILEQEEYKREGIDWQFIDFGLDLQPTIDLIEKSSPIGILSCLDEECVMPKATDKTFTEKLHGLWKGKSTKYDVPRFGQGFILQHYAGKVEYGTETWLDKNKDPLNENITRLLANSSDKYIASLFSDYFGDEGEASPGGGLLKNRTSVLKKGAFRTVAQRHKEQLASLMGQLHTTQPHFVRCIIPNEEKKPGKIDANLVLDQLRCNGVLEGIRICRAGFPNRLLFAEFRQRYEILVPGIIPKGYMDGRKASVQLIEALSLDKNQYRIGTSKVFFRAGVLASLEEIRDARLSAIVSGFQAACRGYLSRRMYRRRLDQLKAIRVIQKNARVYVQLREWSWWRLYSKVKPLLNVTRVDEELKKKEDSIRELAERAQREEAERQRLESVKAQLDAEKLAIEDTLRAERSAAADQQDILIRTQKRELELNEELRAVTQELDTLEEKHEEQAKQRRRLEAELQAAKEELQREKAALERVELEKAAREQQAKQLQLDIATEAERVRLLEIERKSSEARIAELQRSLQSGDEKEGELSRVKLQLQQRIADLEERLEREEAEKLVSERNRGTLEVELKSTKQELSDLISSKNELDASLKRREGELNALQQQLRTETGDKETAERARRELVTKLQAVEAELDTERNERDKLAKQQRKLQGELEQLHTVLEDKGSEQTKQAEFNRLRQTELADLRAQLLAVQADLEDTRRKNAQQLEALKTQIEDARQENSALTRAKQSYEKQAKEASERLEEAEQVQQRLEKSRRTLESDLQAVRLQCQELETNLLEMKNAREAADRQVSQAGSRVTEMEEAVQRLERERSALQKQLSELRDEAQDGERKRAALEQARKKAASDLADLQSRLEEEESSRAELNRKLTTKQAEYDALRERYQKDAQEKGSEMEEKARRLEKELGELQTKYALLEANNDKLEKARSRLTAECEDLKHEMEREHAITRAAEKSAKQIEFQLNAANAQIESERHLRDIAESNCRKLQSTIDSFMLDMEEKSQQMLSVARGKADLEQELKALIDEIGDGGKNVHELEKAKRRLEARVEELEAQLEEEESSRHASEESMRRLTEQLSEFRLKSEHDMAAKEAQMEETRRMLLKEVNSLGEQLDEELMAKNEILKAKKKLESDLEDISNTADSSARSRAEIEKAKKKAEGSLRELQLKLEGEERSRKQLEELANRHEKKSAALASEVERLETALEEETRARKQLEKQASELAAELNGGDGMESKATLLEAKKRLEKEVTALREQLEEADEARAALEAQKSAGSSELENYRNRMAGDLEAKIEKLEDSRRALLAAQRLNQQELEDRNKDISILEKQRRLLQAEADDLKQRLEAEILAKGEEAAGRRKAITELREFHIKFEAEQAKSAEQSETIAMYRQKADDATTRLEAAELAKLKVEKSEGTLRIQLKEMEDSLAEANKDRKLSDERVKSLEDQIADLQDKMDEDSAEVADLGLIRRRLQEEVEELRERSKRDLDEREAAIDATRKKYQKELKQLAAELESEKTQILALRETSKKFETEAEDLNARLELELRSGLTWRKDKERLEARVVDLTRMHSEAVAAHDELQSQTATLLAQVRDLRSNLDDADAQRLALEKSKRNLEARIEELNDTAHEANKSRQAAMRSMDAKDQECIECRSQMEEALDAAEAHQEKLRKAEMIANDSLAELQKERDANSELERSKLALEKQNKELSLRILDLEAGAMADSSKSSKRLETRLEDLASQLDSEARDKNDALRNARKTERTIRELQYSLAERDKARSRYEDDMNKMQERMAKMKQQIEELEMSENNLQLVKRRAEREALENKERAIRFEKEVEKLKSRLDRAVYTS